MRNAWSVADYAPQVSGELQKLVSAIHTEKPGLVPLDLILPGRCGKPSERAWGPLPA